MDENLSTKLLSDITVFQKYSRYLDNEQRRESWDEICTRYENMLLNKFPELSKDINIAVGLVRQKKILPSMRAMQFGGSPIELKNERCYNCSYAPMESIDCFSEAYFLLLCGTGFGYSVQNRHISKLPEIKTPKGVNYYFIEDTIEGWADALKVLLKAYLEGGPNPSFDYSLIRPKGSKLSSTGGKAPGSGGLRLCLDNVRNILESKSIGSKLTSLDVHSIMCHVADSVLSGGVRRSSLISLFDKDDELMLTCKSGEWYINNGHFARANNSVVLNRETTTKEQFDYIFKKIEDSNAGEPGILWTNNEDIGTNPCCEISLRPYTFCNLVELNGSNIESFEDLENRCMNATLLGTLQASYTDFKYLRPIWKTSTEEDALIGVGITGIASNKIKSEWLQETSYLVKKWNEYYANLIGINLSARCTTIKPSGSTSCVLGTSSGIHGWHDEYYIRRMRILKTDALYTYLNINNPEILEDCAYDPSNTSIVNIPIKATEGGTMRNESIQNMLERIKTYNIEWVREGHRSGDNYNNVSATVTINKDNIYGINKNGDSVIFNYLNENENQEGFNEWYLLREWMWDNKEFYSGISILPEDLGSYKQTPFESITKEKYEELVALVKNLDLTKVIEIEDNTVRSESIACAGGQCSIE